MKVKVFSVRDEKANSFGQPFFAVNDNIARRMFSDLVEDPKSMVARHPDDFKLYSLGEFDDNSGELSPLAQPEFLAHGVDFINVK